MNGGCASARRGPSRLALAACLGAACLPFWPGEARADCDAEKAQFAVSRPYTAAMAEKARIAAGASTMRKMEPGRAYTMEFRADRLILHVDRRGVVTSAGCG
ncbi:MAG TPA: I78 family peptidase inhibitor [Beijerinckiaceae bacterium]